jgi:primase-polymerase (primpol)-like protein
VWTCKEHIRGNKYCTQLSVKEEILEAAFTRTFNTILADRNAALRAVEESVTEAMIEAEDGTGTAEEIAAVDAEIESLQAQMIDLNKQRTRREIDGAVYNERTQTLKEQLDALFEKWDDLAEAQNTGALSMARHKIISELLEDERTRTEFDKDAFAKLIEVVRVYGRDDIRFIFKDGAEIRAELGAAE